MQVSPRAFDVSAPTPIRALRPSQPLKSRLFAAAITVAAHILAVAAIVAGLRQANILHQPDVVTVYIDVPKQKPQDMPMPLPVPVMVRPSVITAPVPLFNIAPPTPGVAPPPTMPTASIAPPVPSAGQLTLSHAVETWQASLLAHIQQAKRYPVMARARRQQGVVVVHFTMDRQGNVLTANISKSSGYDLLDQEALAMVRRAQPLPKPPPEFTGSLDMVVGPIEFFLTNRR